ncbi:MAG: hypothetical protein RBR18_01485 [Desulfovibrionaceae bacterium]|nr:hypothetical protein [Desulfovibrionaceae bacterium]
MPDYRLPGGAGAVRFQGDGATDAVGVVEADQPDDSVQGVAVHDGGGEGAALHAVPPVRAAGADGVSARGILEDGLVRPHGLLVDLSSLLHAVAHAGRMHARARDAHHVVVHDLHVDARDVGDDVGVGLDIDLHVGQAGCFSGDGGHLHRMGVSAVEIQ